MNPTTLRALAAKLQAAPVGSRELDAECALALGWKNVQSIDIFNEIGVHPKRDFPESLPHWTTSLDASRALAKEMLPGIMVSSSCYKGGCSATMWSFFHETHAATEPLAGMAAILLALAAKIEGEEK